MILSVVFTRKTSSLSVRTEIHTVNFRWHVKQSEHKSINENKYENRRESKKGFIPNLRMSVTKKIRALATRAVGEILSSSNLRLQKPSWVTSR